MDVQEYKVGLGSINTLVFVPDNVEVATNIIEELLAIGIQISVIISHAHKLSEWLRSSFTERRSLPLAGIGGVQSAGFIAAKLREPGTLESVQNGLTKPLAQLGIPEDQADRYAQDIINGRILVVALVPTEKMSTVTRIVATDLQTSANNVSIRVASVGGRSVAQITGFLAAFERAYNGLRFFESLSGEAMMRYLTAWQTHSARLTDDRLRLEIWPNDRLILKRVELSSPGFWEFFGKLNPLEVIRLYLNDRHERCKDKKYREANEEVRLQLENSLLANQVVKERLAIGQSIGLTKREMAPLINEILILPMHALSQYQDDGLIEMVEVVENPDSQ